MLFILFFKTDFGPLTYGDDDLLPADVTCALRSVQFIAKHTKETDRDIEVHSSALECENIMTKNQIITSLKKNEIALIYFI